MKYVTRILALFVVLITMSFPVIPSSLGSDWHDDPDGDGILTTADLCPWVYDPAQIDVDLDGLGDPCDPDFAPPANGGPISDLRIEHVTPYGAWFSFTSPHSAQWGWDATIAWSTDPNELTTSDGFSAAYARGDAIPLDVDAGFGDAIMEPAKMISLEPGTTYYAAATKVNWDGLDPAIGNLVTWQTAPDPASVLAITRPRVFATATQIAAAQTRRAGGDSHWWTWENLMQPRVHLAVTDPPSVYLGRHYCRAAALLFLTSGDPADLSDAEALLQENTSYWQDNALTGNQYRWEDSELAVCTDLLWDHLDVTTREAAVAAFLEDDETHISEGTPRYGDTDEFASITRNWIVHGLTACATTGIDPGLANRGCAVLDAGLRLWHGVQLVRARRDRGFWATSGGFLPDGSDYGQGTSQYWQHTFLALSNAGEPATPYADFVSNNLIAMALQLFSPSQLGFATAGDVEDFSFNWSNEANSFQLEAADAGLLTLHAAVLDSAGVPDAAAWARYSANELYDDQASANGFYRLLFESDGSPEADHRQELAHYYLDSGLGILFDRSSWSSDASYIFARAGWNGVDHSHGDIGHFQFYRRGRWITHEAIGYDGTASDSLGHNVLLLQVPEDGSPGDPGQSRFTASQNRLIRVSSDLHHGAMTADVTGAYTPHRETAERYYSSVQRSLVWLKTDEQGSSDVLVVRDLINRSPSAPAGLVSRWQLHLDENPTINGHRADVTLTSTTVDQQLAVDVLLPADASLSVIAPEGPPDGYPAQVYTHRLLVDTAVDASERVFLTVLQAADAGAAPTTPTAIDSSEFAGALVGGDLVLFNKSPQQWDSGGAQSLHVEIATTDAIRVFVLGMLPNMIFMVSAAQNDAILSIDMQSGLVFPADSGGLIAFTIDAARAVEPLYANGTIFKDGFESQATDRWSLVHGEAR